MPASYPMRMAWMTRLGLTQSPMVITSGAHSRKASTAPVRGRYPTATMAVS